MAGDLRRTPFTQPILGGGNDPRPPLATPSLGQLGRYELLSLLAKGGMGEVFLARARGPAGFEKLVVIKRNLPTIAPEREPLFAEARLAATLQHTNIVQVYDVDTDGGTVFIAMEFLHGQDTRNILKRAFKAGGRLPLDHAIAIALAVCAGLDYAHDKRDADGTPLEIVHRDVSPSNVFVTYDGGVKLIDFGIAKATTLPSETQMGTVKGKPGYMSPEQCKGESLDRRSDLFCVGILLFELTTGRRPFQADGEYQLYKLICESAVTPPSSFDPAYPSALETIVLRALHKERRERYPTARALQDELTKLAKEQRLDVSQFALGRYMATLFSDELDAWRNAQRIGQSLAEHVIQRSTATVRVVPAGVGAPATSSVIATLPMPSQRRAARWRLAAAVAAIVAVGSTIAVVSLSSTGNARDAAQTAPIDTQQIAPVESPRAAQPPPPDAIVEAVAAPVDAAAQKRQRPRPPPPAPTATPDASPGVDDPIP